MTAIRFFTDEDVYGTLAAALRAAGCDAVSTPEAGRLERGHQVTLPEDVRRYFATLNGTGNDMDNDTYRFWPLAEVKPVYEVLAPSRGFEYPDGWPLRWQ